MQVPLEVMDEYCNGNFILSHSDIMIATSGELDLSSLKVPPGAAMSCHVLAS